MLEYPIQLAASTLKRQSGIEPTRVVHRKRSGRRACALALLLYALDSPAQELPAPFEASYAGSKFPLSAEVTISLARIGDYYRYTLRGAVYAPFFKWTDIYDCSVMRVRGDGFFPLEYVHRDTHDRDHDVNVHFDRERRSVRATRGDGKVIEAKELGQVAWDPMSIQVRLRADVASANRASVLTYDIVERDKVKRRRVKFSGVEELDSDPRPLQIVKAETEGGKHRDEFWFAKNYAWLPVRVSMAGVTLDLVSAPEKAGRAAAPATDQPPSCK